MADYCAEVTAVSLSALDHWSLGDRVTLIEQPGGMSWESADGDLVLEFLTGFYQLLDNRTFATDQNETLTGTYDLGSSGGDLTFEVTEGACDAVSLEDLELRVTRMALAVPEPMMAVRLMETVTVSEASPQLSIGLKETVAVAENSPLDGVLTDDISLAEEVLGAELRETIVDYVAAAELFAVARGGSQTELISVLETLSSKVAHLIVDGVAVSDALRGGLILEDVIAVLDALSLSHALHEWVTIRDETSLWFSLIDTVTASDEMSVSEGGRILEEVISLVTRVFLESVSRYTETVRANETLTTGMIFQISDSVAALDALTMSLNLVWWDQVNVSDVLTTDLVELIIGCEVTLTGGGRAASLQTVNDVAVFRTDMPPQLNRC